MSLRSFVISLSLLAAASVTATLSRGAGSATVTGMDVIPLATSLTPNSIELTARPVSVTLASSDGLAVRLAALPPGHRIYLRLNNLRAQSQPGTLFHVFLGNPSSMSASSTDPRHLGTVNFFSAVRLAGATPAPDAPLIDQTLDVTDAVKTLVAKRYLSEPLTLTFIATNAPAAGSRPTIGHVDLIEQ